MFFIYIVKNMDPKCSQLHMVYKYDQCENSKAYGYKYEFNWA